MARTGGEGVVGALALVDVVVGMHLAPLAQRQAQQLVRTVRNHLVN